VSKGRPYKGVGSTNGKSKPVINNHGITQKKGKNGKENKADAYED